MLAAPLYLTSIDTAVGSFPGTVCAGTPRKVIGQDKPEGKTNDVPS